jgi:hypothetical protein
MKKIYLGDLLMKANTHILSKLTLGLIVTALCSSFSLLSHSSLAGQGMKTDPIVNQKMLREMENIKASLEHGEIPSAKESLSKMKQLAGSSRMYDKVIELASTKIQEKESGASKVDTPKGTVSKTRPLPPVPDISDEDIKAFDDAFDTNNVEVMQRIFRKYPKTDHDSPKKTNFLDEATKALTHMRANPRKELYGTKTRTPIGAIKKAPELTKEPTKSREALYGTKVRIPQGAINKSPDHNRTPDKSQEGVYGTKTRTPMGAQKSLGVSKEGDIIDSDIEAFKNAYETNNVTVAETIISKYPRTPHDSPKKKEFLDLAEMQIQVMR